jgi:hypothetical protein
MITLYFRDQQNRKFEADDSQAEEKKWFKLLEGPRVQGTMSNPGGWAQDFCRGSFHPYSETHYNAVAAEQLNILDPASTPARNYGFPPQVTIKHSILRFTKFRSGKQAAEPLSLFLAQQPPKNFSSCRHSSEIHTYFVRDLISVRLRSSFFFHST